MSKHSIRYNINQRKFSLKFILYLFIMIDILLYFNIETFIFFQVMGWELFTFMGLLIGMRGQVRYRELVYDLIAIRQDPKYNDKEELRGFKLARHIDHACIEWDLWFQEQQHKSTKKLDLKIPTFKKTKKRGKIMKTEAIKELLAWVGAWIIAGGIVIDEALYLSGVSLPWIIAITFLWISGDFLYFWYLKNYWDIDKKDIPIVEPPVIIAEINTAGTL